MKIRKEQLAALDRHQGITFETRLTTFLQHQFFDAAEEPFPELQREVAVQIEKARGYHLETEQDIATYAITAWLLSADFDTEFPAANEVLTSEIPGAAKARFLEEWTKEMLHELEK